MKLQTAICTGVILLAAQLISQPASAQERNPALDETFAVRLGPLAASLDATVKAFGQDLNVDESIDTSDIDFAGYGLWRITPRFRLEASYSGIKKSGSDFVANTFNIGSVTIPAGLGVEGRFETSVARLAVGYAFMRGDSSEFGVDLGLNYTSLKESFRVSVPGTPPTEISSLDVSEPLPTVGLFFNYAFTPKLYLTSRFGIFGFDIGDIDGTIFDLYGGLEYRPWEHFGFGLAYMYNSADVTITDDGLKTDIEYDYNGPLLYVVAGF